MTDAVLEWPEPRVYLGGVEIGRLYYMGEDQEVSVIPVTRGPQTTAIVDGDAIRVWGIVEREDETLIVTPSWDWETPDSMYFQRVESLDGS